ncbi:MAG: NUDIX domain-containing protein [Bdellovibrionaceae bacterium]|nr:NUDIX domain-containing protein [Pseudobdellovibrionaceae bacterium]
MLSGGFVVREFRIYVRGIIAREDGLVLMVLKGPDQKMAPGKWLLPGGAVEFGEEPEAALARELLEEINFSVRGTRLLRSETRVIEQTHWLGLIYSVEGDVRSIRNLEPEKHVALEWRPLPSLGTD